MPEPTKAAKTAATSAKRAAARAAPVEPANKWKYLGDLRDHPPRPSRADIRYWLGPVNQGVWREPGSIDIELVKRAAEDASGAALSVIRMQLGDEALSKFVAVEMVMQPRLSGALAHQGQENPADGGDSLGPTAPVSVAEARKHLAELMRMAEAGAVVEIGNGKKPGALPVLMVSASTVAQMIEQAMLTSPPVLGGEVLASLPYPTGAPTGMVVRRGKRGRRALVLPSMEVSADPKPAQRARLR